MSDAEDLRATKILSHARRLYHVEYPDRQWPRASDLVRDDQLMRVEARYLQRAEHELLAAGAINSVDQS